MRIAFEQGAFADFTAWAEQDRNCLLYTSNNAGRNPAWTSYEKLRAVIEKKMFSTTEDLLPVISFNAKASAEEQKKHAQFVLSLIHI